jgi:hypothetical protein
MRYELTAALCNRQLLAKGWHSHDAAARPQATGAGENFRLEPECASNGGKRNQVIVKKRIAQAKCDPRDGEGPTNKAHGDAASRSASAARQDPAFAEPDITTFDRDAQAYTVMQRPGSPGEVRLMPNADGQHCAYCPFARNICTR